MWMVEIEPATDGVNEAIDGMTNTVFVFVADWFPRENWL